MHTGIDLSAKAPPKQHVEAVVKGITQILAAGKQHNHDQETVRCALGILAKLTVVEGATISHSNIIGDKTVHMGEGLKTE